MLESWSSSPEKYIFHLKSRSKRSTHSIALLFVVGALGSGTNFEDNPNTISIAGGRDLPGVRSYNMRLEGDEK